MAHPIMFDESDPYLERVRQIALALPGSDVKISHGRPAFFTQKVFAYYGGSIKIDGEYVNHGRSVVFRPEESDRLALAEDELVYVPAYLGPSGWLGLDLRPDTDWDELRELITDSYRLTARKGLLAQLETTPEM